MAAPDPVSPVNLDAHRFSVRLKNSLRLWPWIKRAEVFRVCRWVVIIHTPILCVWVALGWNRYSELGPSWVMGFWIFDFPSSWVLLSMMPASWMNATAAKVLMTPIFLAIGAAQWSIVALTFVQLDRFVRDPKRGI